MLHGTIINSAIISFRYYFIFAMKFDNYYLTTIISNIILRLTIIWYITFNTCKCFVSKSHLTDLLSPNDDDDDDDQIVI